MVEWIANNKEWFLEGLGVFILSIFITFIVWLINRNKTNPHRNYSQSMGNKTKSKRVTFKNNQQIIGKSENEEEN